MVSSSLAGRVGFEIASPDEKKIHFITLYKGLYLPNVLKQVGDHVPLPDKIK